MIPLLFFAAALGARVPGDSSTFRVTNAEERHIASAQYEECMGRSHYNEDWVQCVRNELDHLDKLSSAAYRAALTRMPDQRSQQWLRASQSRWLKERDNKCFDEAWDAGPTPYDMVFHQCTIDDLIQRIAWLRHLRNSH